MASQLLAKFANQNRGGKFGRSVSFSKRTLTGQRMSTFETNTPGCRKFEDALAPQIAEFLAKYSMTQLGDVRYYGPDPKGGYLYLMFFSSPSCLMKVRTVDGAAEVLVGPLIAPREWGDEGWCWPNLICQMSDYSGPGTGELKLLQGQITELIWL
jgi:hypothetical protein